MTKAYIGGKITGLENYKTYFLEAQRKLEEEGKIVLNPTILPYPGFEHHEYMHVCYAMIDICNEAHFLPNWENSLGARMELEYALKNGKAVIFIEGADIGL